MQQQIVDYALGRDAAVGKDSESLATSAEAAMRSLLDELRPLVGDIATRALYSRSLQLSQSSFIRPDPGHAETLDALLLSLHADLAKRSPSDALDAASKLIHALVDLLVSLIGEHLTHRMLTTAWGIPQSILMLEEKPQ